MKKISLFLFICQLVGFLHLGAFAATDPLLDSAQAAYAKGNYVQANQFYERITSTGLASSGLYFNLGNSYFKHKEIPLAILNYERAKKLSPMDEDIQFNLNLAKSKLVDKVEPMPQFFLKKWLLVLVHQLTEKQWCWLFLGTFWIGIVLLAVYWLAGAVGIRKIAFIFGLFTLAPSGLLFLMAKASNDVYFNHQEAIVIAPTINIKGSPSEEGTTLFVLHEGIKVEVHSTLGDWTEVKLPNGNLGWLKTTNMVVI